MNSNTSKVFNNQQQQAIDSNAPLILTIASPGSGKTATVVARINRLLGQGVPASRMCVITFTNAAAVELQQRIAREWIAATTSVEFDASAWRIKEGSITTKSEPLRLGYVGTLHGLMFRLLQKHGGLVGLPPGLTILDEEAADLLFDLCKAAMKVKTPMKELKELRRTFFDWSPTVRNWTPAQLAVKEYYSRMMADGAVDFDSILLLGFRLLQDIKSKPNYEQLVGFDWLFVDEFQDSSNVDFEIYSTFPALNKFFVGDPDQSIYGFRGGNVENILQVARCGCEVINLELNYRSDRAICDAAESLIAHNVNRVPKRIISARPDVAGTVESHGFELPDNELHFILNDIRKNHERTAQGLGRECAVLYLTNAQVDRAVEYLAGHGLPVVKRSARLPAAGEQLGRTALAVMLNPFNDMTASRLINLVHGEQAATKARQDADINLRPVASLFGQLAIPDGELDGQEFNAVLANFAASTALPLDGQIYLTEAAKAMPSRFTVADLLLSLNQRDVKEDGAGVVITTYHGSKGREFETVYVAGAEQETTPGQRKDVNVEEERRLFFVACTRAMHRLVITHCRQRNSAFASWKFEPRHPSQFVAETEKI